ncbi:MAG: hypothetical protein WC714_27935 [Candidatus Obscuribacterales bacterium]|jgi:hypothetical protein
MGLRSVVKHSYINVARGGRGRAKAHVNYIKFRPGKDKDEGARTFFSDKESGLPSKPVLDAIDRQKDHGVLLHKIIVSPGVKNADTQEYVREVMHEMGRQKGLDLEWYAVAHGNTANPHAHVVVMATDKKGRQVRLGRDDYTKLKESGDLYLERNKLYDKVKVREGKVRPFGGKLKSALKAAKDEFVRVMRSDEEERKLTRQEILLKQEEDSLGTAPTYDELAARRQEKEERKKTAQDEAWKYYSKAIEVKFGDEVVAFNWTQSLGELRALERRHAVGQELGKPLLSDKDLERLQTWIKDSYYEEKVLSARAERLERIELNGEGGGGIKVTPESRLEELREVQRMSDKGAVVLTSVEEKALTKWIDERESNEPIVVSVPGESKVRYDKKDSKETLEFLASEYRKGEDWAKDGITKREYQKLRSWIKEKRHPDDKERTNEKAPKEEQR